LINSTKWSTPTAPFVSGGTNVLSAPRVLAVKFSPMNVWAGASVASAAQATAEAQGTSVRRRDR
jgi:hypothetical protein